MNGRPRLLLLRAYNYWDFPKGISEAGESPLQTALRELKEETQISIVKFSWGEVFFETAPYGQGKTARYYLAETTTLEVALLPNAALGRPEHQEYRWVSFADAQRLVNMRLQAVVGWAEKTITSG